MATKQPNFARILRELLERLTNARELLDVNIAAAIAPNELNGKTEDRP